MKAKTISSRCWGSNAESRVCLSETFRFRLAATASASRLGSSIWPTCTGMSGAIFLLAFLRAILEAQGRRVHAYTSPHLVRFNERIRLAGKLIDDGLLASLLEDVLDVAADLQASFFEVTTAAAF